MGPIANADGHDPPGLIDEVVPSLAAMVDDVVVGFKDSVWEPVVAQELPDVFLRIELRTFRRQRDQGDVGRHDEPARQMPAGLIDEKRRVCARRDLSGDFGRVQVYGLRVASGHDEGCTLSVLGADRAEDISRGGSLVRRRARTRAALGPAAGELFLFGDAGLVGEPDLYGVGLAAFLAPDLVQARGKAFLKSSIAPSACS